MRLLTVMCGAMLLVVASAGPAFAARDEASADRGKALFNDAALGTTGRSCNDCHPGGSGLEGAGTKTDLEQTINRCVTGAIKGKALDAQSVDMQSLEMYIKDLGAVAKQR